MDQITIKDIEPLVPFSRGSTEIFLTGHWSSKKPVWAEKTSPCRQACPIGNDIARAFSYASQGALDEALAIYRQDNPLPGVCGRVCYHPCQSDCNRKDMDEAVNIRGFERYLADNGEVDTGREAPAQKRKEKVAVIGSGPAGLSAAHHLARLGFSVTVYEALPEPGGMLMYGIPEYRLPKEILKREIGFIEELGVTIKTSTRIGKDLSLDTIKKEYQAVFLAVGAQGGVRLGIDGEDLPGVMEGIAFLRNVNLGKELKVGKKVAVIGGGNTAIDCARAALRLGADDVRIIYRRTRAEMPALGEDVASVEAEGANIDLLASPKRIVAQNGRVLGVECLRMELGPPDASGRPRPVPVKDSEFTISIDTIIAAVGQTPEVDFLKDLGVVINRAGMITVSPDTAATNVPGVFAGGDGAGTKAFVADAIASGKMGALAISCFLDGKDVTKEFPVHRIGNRLSFSFQHVREPESYPFDLKKIVTYDQLNTICFPYAPQNANPDRLKPEKAARSFGEVSAGLDTGRAEAEIARCFKCGTCTQCELCFLICPDISVVKPGKEACPDGATASSEGYTVKSDYCKGCGVCATTCPRQVIEMTQEPKPFRAEQQPGSASSDGGSQ